MTIKFSLEMARVKVKFQQMMILFGAMERTEKQWRTLLSSVGLTIEKIWTAKQDDESIIEAVLL